MSLHKRLEALEARLSPPDSRRRVHIPRSMERYWHTIDNARRVRAGFPPLPDIPYTKEDYEDDLRTLQETIPAMKESPGWQTEEARTFLDGWERDLREKLEKGT